MVAIYVVLKFVLERPLRTSRPCICVVWESLEMTMCSVFGVNRFEVRPLSRTSLLSSRPVMLLQASLFVCLLAVCLLMMSSCCIARALAVLREELRNTIGWILLFDR